MENGLPAGRSMPVGKSGMVVSSQPLATQAGLEILKRGGNAADATVAMAAMLNVVEPMSTGIGGDAYVLVYDAKSRAIKGLNASGRAPAAATLDFFRKRNIAAIPDEGMLPVTVPGALDGWSLIAERFGTKPLAELLAPAIEYAESGFPVAEKAAGEWAKAARKLAAHPNSSGYLPGGRAPKAGEIFRQPALAASLKKIAAEGRDAFYRGALAREIVRFSEANGGLLSLDDFAKHTSTWVEPIKTNYRGYEVIEMPPNTQGLTVLEMLNILERHDVRSLGFGSAEYIHLLVEAKKLAFADRDRYLADQDVVEVPTEKLISKSYAAERGKKIDPARAQEYPPGVAARAGDTQVFCAVDRDGNAVSFINSLFESFGCGLVAGATGVMLHNRGKLFALDPAHLNCVAPHKRPMHTIMPAMMFKDGRPLLIFGVTGAHMQPQGQVEMLINMIDFGMPLQQAMDAPRVNHVEGFEVALEPGFSADTRAALAQKGHRIINEANFGGSQGILIHPEYGTLLGGSDPRKDGCALGY
jgi:gamma-glutamyltranspeptidase/glutathione hydrolase